jgi:23S rRNA (cytidine2498-2'-O)-methyltransferase
MISESASFLSSPHVFAACNAGSEKLLKADVASIHPELRPAFMRPQLVTWKSPAAMHRPPRSLFARVAGLSLGVFEDAGQVAAALEGFREDPMHLHVFSREVPSEGLTSGKWAQIDAWAAEFRQALTARGVPLHDARRPREGECVLDVMLDIGTDGKFLAGIHRHGEDTHPCPGGIPRVSLPADAPSRAWLKMEQALVFAGWEGAESLRGKVALELGSAPGGASLSLLQHGVTVFGVDAAEMDRRVLDFTSADGAHFVHFKMNAGQVPRSLLPGRVDLLACDLNAAPHVIIPIVERLQEQVRASLFLLTMKLNDEVTAARVPEFLRRLRRFAPAPVRPVQLAANRSEFCVVAGGVR